MREDERVSRVLVTSVRREVLDREVMLRDRREREARGVEVQMRVEQGTVVQLIPSWAVPPIGAPLLSRPYVGEVLA